MKALWLVLLVASALSASESYMVVRLVNSSSRDVVTRSHAVEVTHPDLRPDEVLVYATDAQLEEIRNEPSVAFVYPASVELIAGVPVHTCTPPQSALIGEYVMNMGKGWSYNPKAGVRLTYSVESITQKLGREQTLDMLQRAFQEWSRYVQVDFAYTDSKDESRNLNVLFASGAHGDPYPFDGPRKTLAHTFYPADLNPEPIAGDLHFDEDENWQTGVDPDFYSVVLHEIGHALGLGHSDRPNAVMYPYYRRLENLLPDDIDAARRIYPERVETSSESLSPAAPIVPTTPAPVSTPTAPEPTPPATSSDRTAPTLRVTMPATTILATSAATARISGTASDSVGVKVVSWTASGGRSGVANGTTTWTIPDFALRMGDNSIVIRAFDEAGNSSFRSLTITRR